MEDDYTPEQQFLMMGPGFGDEIARGVVWTFLIALAVVAAVGFGVGWGVGWLVFG